MKERLIKLRKSKKGPLTLRKAQSALEAARRELFDPTADPYQSADNLILLRNRLVHYFPEWDTEQKMHKEVEDRLKGLFNINPFLAEGRAAFFPNKCFSYGCAKWAVETATAFIDAFYDRVDLDSPLDRVRDRLPMEPDVGG